MERTERLLGKLLGEVYRIQKHLKGLDCGASDAQIYGLLNGLERSVRYELDAAGFLPESALQAVEDVLNEYFVDSKKLAELTGYYDVEGQLTRRGVDRSMAIRAMKYLKAERRFEPVIDKFNSQNSPAECKTFDLRDWDL